MTSRLIACLSLACACALACAACGAGPAGPPTAPSDPVGGAEPADKTGYEPPGGTADMAPGSGSTVEQLCSFDCMRFASICPGSGSGGSDCVTSCAQSVTSFPGCEAEFRSYLACLTTAPVTCTNGNLTASGCEGAVMTLSNCAGAGGGTAGGGSAGAGGSSSGGGTK